MKSEGMVELIKNGRFSWIEFVQWVFEKDGENMIFLRDMLPLYQSITSKEKLETGYVRQQMEDMKSRFLNEQKPSTILNVTSALSNLFDDLKTPPETKLSESFQSLFEEVRRMANGKVKDYKESTPYLKWCETMRDNEDAFLGSVLNTPSPPLSHEDVNTANITAENFINIYDGTLKGKQVYMSEDISTSLSNQRRRMRSSTKLLPKGAADTMFDLYQVVNHRRVSEDITDFIQAVNIFGEAPKPLKHFNSLYNTYVLEKSPRTIIGKPYIPVFSKLSEDMFRLLSTIKKTYESSDQELDETNAMIASDPNVSHVLEKAKAEMETKLKYANSRHENAKKSALKTAKLLGVGVKGSSAPRRSFTYYLPSWRFGGLSFGCGGHKSVEVEVANTTSTETLSGSGFSSSSAGTREASMEAVAADALAGGRAVNLGRQIDNIDKLVAISKARRGGPEEEDD